jgi:CubicO group peptidase (beta-lactamase class C family)
MSTSAPSPARLGRRPLLALLLAAPLAAGRARASGGLAADSVVAEMLARAAAYPRLHSLLVAHRGDLVLERTFRGPGPDRPVNVKSVSKTLMSALVGIAIERGVLAGVEQPLVDILGDRVPRGADPRVTRITLDHLLTMRAGLERTSGANYGRWVASPDWVRFALTRPFVDEPGGRMLYSTGSWHLLSAALTRAADRSTLDLARDWLARPLGFELPPWPRDPQGIYMGGNDMALSPRALLRFGETYRQGGLFDGRRVLSEDWIRTSWIPRGESPYSGHAYGYGWFLARMRGRDVFYGRGYGGQLLHVVPDLGLTVVMTSDPAPPSPGGTYVRALHALVETGLIPAAERAG